LCQRNATDDVVNADDDVLRMLPALESSHAAARRAL
jgi:hypothetical protein